MKLRGRSLLLLAALSFAKISAQSKRVADRYFEEFSFVQSAELYKAIVVEKGDSSKHVLSRLADSYYNNANTSEALNWYEILIKKYNDDISDKYLFRYAQVLRSNGDYKKSDSIFLKLAEKGGKNNRTAELENKNYLLDYSKTEDQRIGIRNLKLNTHYSEYGGFLLNGYAYFSSSAPKNDKKQKLYKWNNQPFLNIYKAKESIESLESNVKDTVLELYDRKILPAPITTKYHEGKPVFTKDGKTMYFTRNNFDGKKVSKDRKRSVNLKIYKSRLINGEWSKVEELPFSSDDYSVGHPALSPDEKKLYFVSNMPGGFGGSDVYSVDITGMNEYSDPINLGQQVNTSDNERFPFIGEDGTLYFSSDGHLGYGLLDIFQTKLLDDGNYSKAANLGEPFNSKKDDFAFYIDKVGKKGFFTSNRKGGKGDDDIYSFYIYQDVCEKIVSGRIIDAKLGKKIAGANIKLINSEGEVIDETFSNEKGKYSFKKVPCDLELMISASKFDHKSDKVAVNTRDKDIEVVKADLKLTPLIIGDQIVINPIYFDFNKSDIREDAEYELENIITVMKNHPEIVIKIEAHTDSRGNDLYNKKLSDRRAKSTRDYIVSRGIGKNRIESAIGYGEERLLNNCTNARRNKCTEKEHQVNRRSYFFIVKGKEFIKAKQQAEIIKMKKRMSRKNSYLNFLRNNFKKGKKAKNNKCLVGENCDNKESPNKM